MHNEDNKRNVWFTSDWHVNHRNICRYTARPWNSVEEMNRALIENCNAVVGPDDTLYHLGDFAFCKIEQIESVLRQLHCKIRYFIVGNHDKELLNNKQRLLDKGLISSLDYYKEITVEKQKIILFHYGCRVWNGSHYGSWQIFGHSHNSLSPQGFSVDCGLDSTWITGQAEYRPFSFNEIKRFMDKQKIVNNDFHGKDNEK